MRTQKLDTNLVNHGASKAGSPGSRNIWIIRMKYCACQVQYSTEAQIVPFKTFVYVENLFLFFLGGGGFTQKKVLIVPLKK